MFAIEKYGKISAFAAALDMSPSNAQAYIRGARTPGSKVLARLRNLGCDITWLLTGEGNMLTGGNPCENSSDAAERSKTMLRDDRLHEEAGVYDQHFGMTMALGSKMCVNGILEGDLIFFDENAVPEPGDHVLCIQEDIPAITAYREGLSDVIGVITRLVRNYSGKKRPQTA